MLWFWLSFSLCPEVKALRFFDKDSLYCNLHKKHMYCSYLCGSAAVQLTGSKKYVENKLLHRARVLYNLFCMSK